MYYALDVTEPVNGETEDTIASSRVLWEFTHPDLGFSYGEPLIVKTDRWGWVVIFSSGYNNASGLGYIFVVHPETGKLIARGETKSGTPLNPAGLTELTGFTYDPTSGIFKWIYGGDLDGNVWRFELPPNKQLSPSDTIAVVTLANLTDANGVAQPITVPPG